MALNQRVGRAVLELSVDKTEFAGGLSGATGDIKAFTGTVTKTYRDMVQGMSAAAKAQSDNTKLLVGMAQAGRQAAMELQKTQTLSAQIASGMSGRGFTSQIAAQRKELDALAKGMSVAGKEATASSKLIAGMGAAGKQAAEGLKVATGQMTLAQRASAALKSTWAQTAAGFALGNIATNAVSALIGAGRGVAEFASHMVDLSDETQISMARLQAWDRVLVQAGLTVDDLLQNATQLQKRLGSGDDSAAAALRKLGLSAEELIRMKPDEAVLKILDATSRLGTQSEKTSTLFELLGRTGPRMLRIAGEGLAQTIEEISKSSDVIRDDMLHKADQFDEGLDLLIKSMKARVVNFLGWYQDRVKETGTLPFGLDKPNSALGPVQLPNAPPKPGLFTPPIRGAQAPANVPPPDFVQSLATARKAVAELSKAQRDQIVASQQSGASANETADLLKRYGLEAYSVSLVLSIINEKQKTVTATAIENAKKYGTLTSALTATGIQIRALTASQQQEIESGLKIGASTDEIALKLGIAKEVVAGYKDNLEEATKAQKAMAESLGDLVVELDKAANLKGLQQAGRVLTTAVNVSEAKGATADTFKQIAIQRAEFEAQMAEKSGAAWQTVAMLQTRAARLRLQADIDAENERFKKTTAGLDESSAEFAAYTTEHNAKVQEMTEAFAQGEAIKRSEIHKTITLGRSFLNDLKSGSLDAFQEISGRFASMAVGMKDSWKDVWQSMQRIAAQILSSMLQQFAAWVAAMIVKQRVLQAAGIGTGAAGGAGGTGAGGGTGWKGIAQDVAMKYAGKYIGLGAAGGSAVAGTTAGTALLGGAVTTGGGGLLTSTSIAGSLAAPSVAGGSAAAAGTAATTSTAGGGAMGFLANPAFWTNPWTIAGVGAAALLTWAIAKKGLFRGGEEGVQVNPKRDKFIAQFGDSSNKGTGGGGWKLASLLTKDGAGPGGGPLFSALQSARKMKTFQAAEDNIISFLAAHGKKGIKKFHTGGIVGEDGDPADQTLGNGEVLIKALRGEAVLTKRGTAAVGGRPVIDALNTGRGASAGMGHALRGMFGGKATNFKTFATDLMAKMAAHGAKATGAHVRSFGFFANGAYIPPGVVQPAVLHGGSRGEYVIPGDRMDRSSAAPASPQVIIHAPLHLNGGILSPETVKEFHAKHIIRLNSDALFHNRGNARTDAKRHLGIK